MYVFDLQLSSVCGFSGMFTILTPIFIFFPYTFQAMHQFYIWFLYKFQLDAAFDLTNSVTENNVYYTNVWNFFVTNLIEKNVSSLLAGLI